MVFVGGLAHARKVRACQIWQTLFCTLSLLTSETASEHHSSHKRALRRRLCHGPVVPLISQPTVSNGLLAKQCSISADTD